MTHMGSIFKKRVSRSKCLKYNPTPTIAPTVTWLVDCGIFKILARKSPRVAALRITNTTLKLMNP